MSKLLWWIVGLLVILVIAVLVFHTPGATAPGGTATTTPATFDRSISDGTITIAYPSADFGLATDPTQILVHAYIPPCDQNFNYCLYYNGGAYAGTNFESAGLRIDKRIDLTDERVCLGTPPDGYDASIAPSATTSADTYSSSVFSNLSDAGAGHYANGSLYRLFVRSDSSCYELETRVGATQYANYPAGSIQEFTAADQASVANELAAIIQNVSLGGVKNLFPRQ